MAKSAGRVLAAFSVDHAARVTELSKSRLTRWDKLGFFSPEYVGDDDRGNAYARVYSFVDLVGLRTLKILADEYRVPLSELRRAAKVLADMSDRPWSDIPLGPIAREVQRKTVELAKRNKSQIGKVERHRFVVHNATVIAGTRIPVAAVASFIRAGYSDRAIVAEYPTLTIKDIRAIRRRMRVAA
jgi:uncharacterized protein (DUF433 family)